MLLNRPCDYEYLMKNVTALSESGVVRREVLTHSILGREIPLLSIGNGKKTVVYVGAHHGMEWITAGVLLDFVAEYLGRLERKETLFGQRLSYLFSERRVLIVPMLNPDGVEYALHGVDESNPLAARVMAMNGSEDFSHWQANARGVDLNHNYNAGFAAYKALEKQNNIPCGAPTRYSGEYPESEPETAALCRYLRLFEKDVCGVLSLHTQGEEIFCNCADKLSAKCMAAGRILQRMTGYRLARPEGLAAFGGLTDWCIEKLSRPAFTLECGRGENPLPLYWRPLIYDKLREALFSFPFMF